MAIYSYDKKLEGLRGICALTVMLAHLFGFNFFGAFYSSASDPILHLQFASIAVLIFFIISGYVMGVSHVSLPFNYTNVAVYLKKRFVRLYPIYLIALLISVLFGYKLITAPQLIGHLLFLQGIFVSLISSNPPLWSLSYEFIYYLLFIALWAVNHKSKNYSLLLMLLIVCYTICFPHPTIFNSVILGGVFWIAGLYISQLKENQDKKQLLKPLISYFLIIIATNNLSAGTILMRSMHLTFDPQKNVNFYNLTFLPVCVLIVSEITNKKAWYTNWLKIIAYLIPAFSIITLFYFNHLPGNRNYLYGIACFCIAVVFLLLKTNIYSLERLNFFGKISYAIYVFHFPIGFFLNLYLAPRFSHFQLLIIGTLLWAGLTLGFSVVAELFIQPAIKKLLIKKHVIPSVSVS